MSDQNALLHPKNLFLLTLKGQITIYFTDGKMLSGEFATQDELNIFVTVNGEPLMIPRSQIRYIKGKSGQSIEPDDSQTAFAPVRSGRLPEETLEAMATTVVGLEEKGAAFLTGEEELEDTTLLLEEAEDEDETVFLTEEDDTTTIFITDDDDTTVVIEDETIEPEQQVITAYLDCTTGPHTGDRFELQSGVTTLGRSADNIFALSKDKEISRRHAMITYKDGKFIIEDRGSLNGVMVNDVRISAPRQLEHGDSILVGVSTLVFYEK